MYKIYIATLGHYNPNEPRYHSIDRSCISSSRLEYNLSHLWAWSLSGDYEMFKSDGPAVFISFNANNENLL